MSDSLSLQIEKAFQTLKGQGRITEINVACTIKEIYKALIDVDVYHKVAKEVTDEIKTKATSMNVLTAVSPGQLLTKVTNDELTLLMEGASEDIVIEGNPAIILIAGLQGSGKTTFSGKLANYLKRQGRQVLLTACDIYRPAAIDQLKVLGQLMLFSQANTVSFCRLFSLPDPLPVQLIVHPLNDHPASDRFMLINLNVKV